MMAGTYSLSFFEFRYSFCSYSLENATLHRMLITCPKGVNKPINTVCSHECGRNALQLLNTDCRHPIMKRNASWLHCVNELSYKGWTSTRAHSHSCLALVARLWRQKRHFERGLSSVYWISWDRRQTCLTSSSHAAPTVSSKSEAIKNYITCW